MKKSKYLLLSLALGAFMSSCSTTTTPEVQPKNGKVVFYSDWKNTASYDVTIDGATVSTISDVTTTAPNCDTNSKEFSFTDDAKTKTYTATDGMFTFSGTVTLAEGCTAVMLMHPLVSNQWHWTSYYSVDGTGTTDFYASLEDCQKDNYVEFPKDGLTTPFYYNTLTCAGEFTTFEDWGAWSLTGDQITIGGTVYTIETLTDTELLMYFDAGAAQYYYGYTKM